MTDTKPPEIPPKKRRTISSVADSARNVNHGATKPTALESQLDEFRHTTFAALAALDTECRGLRRRIEELETKVLGHVTTDVGKLYTDETDRLPFIDDDAIDELVQENENLGLYSEETKQ
jgi:hypothetical protein